MRALKKRWTLLLCLCLAPWVVQAQNSETVPSPQVTRIARAETKAYVAWDAVEEADSYRLQYSTDPEFPPESTCTVRLRGPKGTHKHLHGLRPERAYYFRVQAGKAGRRSRWSRAEHEALVFRAEPVPDEVFERMKGLSYPKDDTHEHIRRSDLRYLTLWHVGFDGKDHAGEMICHRDVAEDTVDIFYELYRRDYPIESIRLIDDFDADDEKSMRANNSSCFCYRYIGDTDMLSSHALGRAIDINPLYNPQVVLDEDTKELLYVDPPEADKYKDRSLNFPHKINENDLAYRLFTGHGFLWGGIWEDENDYMHFEKPDDMGEEESLSEDLQ